MKKLTTATDLGGAPIYKSDLRDLFNVDIWNVLDGIFSAQFGADVQGVILSGCVITNNVGNFDMTAGIVYLNGSFMRVPAVTNQAFTQYIKADTVVNDSRIFADGSTHNVMINTPAICAAGIPGSGQYITISSLTSADAQRWGKVFDSLVSTNIIRGLSANQGSIIAGRDITWQNVSIAVGNVTNQAAVNPTSGSGKIYYRRGFKETYISIYFTFSFAAIPTLININNIPAALDAVIAADPLQLAAASYMGNTANSSILGGLVGTTWRSGANVLTIQPNPAYSAGGSITYSLNVVIQG